MHVKRASFESIIIVEMDEKDEERVGIYTFSCVARNGNVASYDTNHPEYQQSLAKLINAARA